MVNGPLEFLEARMASGEMDRDEAQLAVAQRLQDLDAALQGWRSGNRWSLGGLLGKRPPPPRGLYIHGNVGRGKTMLMDLFFETSRLAAKRRLHFHEFMA